MLPLIIAILFLSLGAGGGYAYWTGLIGNRPASVLEEISQELESQGFGTVQLTMDSNWRVTIAGPVNGQSGRSRVLSIVRSNENVTGVNDQMSVTATSIERLGILRSTLAAESLDSINAAIDPDGEVAISGVLNSPEERERLARIIASQTAGGSTIIDNTARAKEWIERDINSALSAAGMYQIRAVMLSDTTASLSGTASDEQHVAHATKIATENGAVDVQNNIRIVTRSYQNQTAARDATDALDEAARAAGLASPSGQSTQDVPRAFRGTHQAVFRNGLAKWLGELKLSSGKIGAVVGNSAYAIIDGSSQMKVQCTFNLLLTEVANNQITLEEQKTKGSLACPGNKRVILTKRNGSSIYGQWLRKKNNSVAFEAELR